MTPTKSKPSAGRGRGVKARARKAGQRLRSWWQGRGTEVCAHCSQTYHYEMEYRCAECDRGLCAVCAVTERESIYCPECV